MYLMLSYNESNISVKTLTTLQLKKVKPPPKTETRYPRFANYYGQIWITVQYFRPARERTLVCHNKGHEAVLLLQHPHTVYLWARATKIARKAACRKLINWMLKSWFQTPAPKDYTCNSIQFQPLLKAHATQQLPTKSCPFEKILSFVWIPSHNICTTTA